MGDFIKGGGWFYPQASDANGEKQNKMTPQETAWELRHLRFEFKMQMATAVNAALESIEEELKAEAAQRQQEQKKAQAQATATSKLSAAYEAAGPAATKKVPAAPAHK